MQVFVLFGNKKGEATDSQKITYVAFQNAGFWLFVMEIMSFFLTKICRVRRWRNISANARIIEARMSCFRAFTEYINRNETLVRQLNSGGERN